MIFIAKTAECIRHDLSKHQSPLLTQPSESGITQQERRLLLLDSNSFPQPLQAKSFTKAMALLCCFVDQKYHFIEPFHLILIFKMILLFEYYLKITITDFENKLTWKYFAYIHVQVDYLVFSL